MTRSVLIYTKPPRIGVAKTRLARGVGRTEARRIAHMTMARTLRTAVDARWQTTLYVAPDRAVSDTFGKAGAKLARRPQGAGDLGARLERGLTEAPRGPVLFIGADAPDISRALIWQAFRALDRHDAVFGPANDGGFWLFGLRTSARTVSPFRGVRWSGPHALADVQANLPAGTRVALLPELIDLDEAEDWDSWKGRA